MVYDAKEKAHICHKDVSVTLSNDFLSGLSHNLTIDMNSRAVDWEYNMDTESVFWGFNDFCINLTDSQETINPTPTTNLHCMCGKTLTVSNARGGTQILKFLCSVCCFFQLYFRHQVRNQAHFVNWQ